MNGGYARKDCNINVKLNNEISIIFHNLRNYDSRFIMQELDKFNFKIHVTPNELEKNMSFKISNKLSLLIDSNFKVLR